MGVLRPRFLIYLFVYLLCLELPGRRGGCVTERPPRPRPRRYLSRARSIQSILEDGGDGTMVLDYSRWDNIDTSGSEDETVAPAMRPFAGTRPPRAPLGRPLPRARSQRRQGPDVGPGDAADGLFENAPAARGDEGGGQAARDRHGRGVDGAPRPVPARRRGQG